MATRKCEKKTLKWSVGCRGVIWRAQCDLSGVLPILPFACCPLGSWRSPSPGGSSGPCYWNSVTRLDRMKRGSGIKGRDDKSSGIDIRITDALAKINPTDPLILAKQDARRNLNCSDSSGISLARAEASRWTWRNSRRLKSCRYGRSCLLPRG